MLYHILKDFPGSQDGRITEQFTAGTTVELSDYLAACVVPYGWARPVQTSGPPPSESTADESGPFELSNQAVASNGGRTPGMRRKK